MTRRRFLERTGAAALGVGLAAKGLTASGLSQPTPTSSRRQVGANEKIVLGVIGCAGMGSANMKALWNYPEIEVAALCDVDSNRIGSDFKAVEDKFKKKPDVYGDYRRMLERKDIDAIIIGSPDHWHALQLIHSVEAGKDVYCEKPISYSIVEAVSMAGAARRFKRVVQVGTWQRSTKEFSDAINYVKSGKLGKIVLCRAWITDSFRAGRQKVQPVPAGLDYDMWIGPAQMVPYKPNHVHWNWRWFNNTGGGMTTDWGVHMMDIALLGMSQGQDLVMPVEVSAHGGQWAILDDDRTAYDTTEALLRFKNPDFVMHWSVRRDTPGLPGHGTEFVSADGKTLRVWRGGWVILGPDGKEIPKEEGPAPGNHWRNFVDCVKSRQMPVADLASVAQTTIVCHLVNASQFSGQTVRWDKQRMDLVGREGRSTIAYDRPYRRPYSLKKYAWLGF
ncbi:MAG TPA: Gfo/Idh/MocA family oxidoreductase [Fimbriimonadaceae bacterium]|nr:Gfo/Idh/MocA family oxidoreductase [Fimbriimonadaceae bacterium]